VDVDVAVGVGVGEIPGGTWENVFP
jgi:hypothetical protein